MSFGSFPLADLPLTPPQLVACERAGYSTAADILLAAPPELNRKLKNLTVQNIQNIVRVVAKAIAPPTNQIIDGFERRKDREGGRSDQAGESSLGFGLERWVGTGDEGLDQALGGGIRTGTLTEISGESAAGKSHLCMALALSAQLTSCTTLPGGAIILTSERELPTDRLIQLAKSMLASHNSSRTKSVKDLLDNIHTNKCTDVDALDHALSYSLPWELEKRRLTETPIRLIVLDSITALFRGADTAFSSSSSGLTQRSRLLCSIADKLKALALEYDLAVVVINQVSDVFNRPAQPPPLSYTAQGSGTNQSQVQPSQVPSAYEYATQFYTDPGPEPPMLYSTQARWFSGQSQGYMKEASLGIVWANAVNTRIMMSRTRRRRRVPVEDLSISSRKRQRGECQSAELQGMTSELDDEDVDGYIGIELDSDAPTLVRRFHVVFSPFAPPSTIDYIIAPSGIHSLSASRKMLDLASIQHKKKVIAAIKAEIETGDSPGGAGMDGMGQEDFGLEDDLGDVPAEFWEGKFADQVAEPEAMGVVGDSGVPVQ